MVGTMKRKTFARVNGDLSITRVKKANEILSLS